MGIVLVTINSICLLILAILLLIQEKTITNLTVLKPLQVAG